MQRKKKEFVVPGPLTSWTKYVFFLMSTHVVVKKTKGSFKNYAMLRARNVNMFDLIYFNKTIKQCIFENHVYPNEKKKKLPKFLPILEPKLVHFLSSTLKSFCPNFGFLGSQNWSTFYHLLQRCFAQFLLPF